MDRQPFKRTDRVSHQIRQIISEAIFSKAHHLGLENVTITGANVSPDLRHARVYFRVIDASKVLECKRALGKAAHLLRKEVARQLTSKNSPSLQFVYDESIDKGTHIESILEKIRTNASDSDEE